MVSRPLLICLLIVFITQWLLGFPGSAQLLWVRWHLWHCYRIHTNSQANGVQLGEQRLSHATIVGSLGCHPIPHAMELGLLSLNYPGQFSDGDASLSGASWARGLCTERTGPGGLLSHLQCVNSLNGFRVKQVFWLQHFLARGVNPLKRDQFCQQGRVGDTSKSLSDSMVDVGINPPTNINF